MSGQENQGQGRQAAINNFNTSNMAPASEWFARPFYPTAPLFSRNQNVGHIPRYYTAALLSTEADYTVNSPTIRRVQFDIPVRLCAMNGSSFNTGAGNAFPVGVEDLNTFLIQAEYSTGEKLIVNPVLASTVLGKARFPGEIGAGGWTLNPGSVLILTITPLLENLRINIVLHCLEIRGASNTVAG